MTASEDLKRGKKLLSDRPDLLKRLLNIADFEQRALKLTIMSARDARTAFGPTFDGLAHEELHAIYTDRRNRIIAMERLTVGSDQYTVVDPKQILRPAVALGAAGFILAHNHPSGDSTCSPQDRDVTRRLCSAARMVGVAFLDRLIITNDSWSSMRETGGMFDNAGALPPSYTN